MYRNINFLIPILDRLLISIEKTQNIVLVSPFWLFYWCKK